MQQWCREETDMSSHPEIHAELEQIAHSPAADEDALLRGMSQAVRHTYWLRQAEWDALMEADTSTLKDMVDMLNSFD